MDTHPSQLTAPLRSRNSQSPSPSHSASASATSSIRKRKLAHDDHAPPFPSPFSDTRDGALTSNDDLDSISARGADSDSDDQSEEVVDEEYDDSSMRNFTTSRLENSGPTAVAARNSKLRTENSVKVEPADVTKDGGTNNNSFVGNSGVPGATGLVPGIVVKEDTAKSIFTENIQTSGAYTSREESLKREVTVKYFKVSDSF